MIIVAMSILENRKNFEEYFVLSALVIKLSKFDHE